MLLSNVLNVVWTIVRRMHSHRRHIHRRHRHRMHRRGRSRCKIWFNHDHDLGDYHDLVALRSSSCGSFVAAFGAS